jgi:acetyl-CoA carboxylase biotin carboxyl carrier protein
MSSLLLLVGRDDEGRAVLKSPALGIWRNAPARGQVARAGETFGSLEVLGRRHDLHVPPGVNGIIVESPATEKSALAYGQVLVVLGDELGKSEDVAASAADVGSDGALTFRSTSSGRFYLRPAPDKAPFVAVGDEIETGHIIFLLEVMKTFSRVAYEGKGMPARAKVLRILPADGDDLEAGQVVLELEAIS